MKPIDLAIQLAERAEGRDLGDPVLEDWLARGLRAWLADGGEIGDCLGLRGTARAEYATAQRCYWLRVASQHVEGASTWAKAQALAVQVRRFEATAWPRLRDCAEAPGGSALRSALWHARRHGRLPSNPTHLHALLSDSLTTDLETSAV